MSEMVEEKFAQLLLIVLACSCYGNVQSLCFEMKIDVVQAVSK